MPRSFKKLLPEYLRCRTVGHQWDERSMSWNRKVTYISGHPISFMCDVCTTERRELWSETTGDLVYRTYTYPAGYSLTRSMVPENMTMRKAMRQEWIARSKTTKRNATRKAS